MLFTYAYAYLGAFALSRKAPVTFIVSDGLSGCIGAPPNGRFYLKYDVGDLMLTSVEEFRIWLKSDENIGHFTLRPKYVLLLPEILNRHKHEFSE